MVSQGGNFRGARAWVRFLLVCRRLQATGLQPCRSNRARALWFLAGWAAGIPGLEIAYWTGWGAGTLGPAISGTIALLAGERLGQISEAIPFRPTTLFGTRDEDEQPVRTLYASTHGSRSSRANNAEWQRRCFTIVSPVILTRPTMEATHARIVFPAFFERFHAPRHVLSVEPRSAVA